MIGEFHLSGGKIDLGLAVEECFVFGNRWNFIESMRLIPNEVVRQGRDADRIAIQMENHLGRRRVDSHRYIAPSMLNLKIMKDLQSLQAFSISQVN